MSLDSSIRRMLSDIKTHNRDRDSLLQHYIQARLDKSIRSYYADLVRVQAILEQKEARRVLRAMSRGGSKDAQT